MRYRHNFQNNLKRKFCNHVFVVLEENNRISIKKCIKCFRIFEV